MQNKRDESYSKSQSSQSFAHLVLRTALILALAVLMLPRSPASAAEPRPVRHVGEAPEGRSRRLEKLRDVFIRNSGKDGARGSHWTFLGFKGAEDFKTRVLALADYKSETGESKTNKEKLTALLELVTNPKGLFVAGDGQVTLPREAALKMSVVRDYFRLLARIDANDPAKLFATLSPSQLYDLLAKLPEAELEALSELLFQTVLKARELAAREGGVKPDLETALLFAESMTGIHINRILAALDKPEAMAIFNAHTRPVDPTVRSQFSKDVLKYFQMIHYGDEEKILTLVDSLEASRDPYRRKKGPLDIAFLTGVAGTGKTTLVEDFVRAILSAQEGKLVLNSEVPVLLIACEGLQGETATTQIFGADPSYVGHEKPTIDKSTGKKDLEAPLLTNGKIRQKAIVIKDTRGNPMYITFVLMDEIQKAHNAVRLGMYGASTTGILRVVGGIEIDLRNSFIFYTSNDAENQLAHFKSKEIPILKRNPSQSEFLRKLAESTESLRLKELLNRTTPLTSQEIQEVANELAKSVMITATDGRGETKYPFAFIGRLKGNILAYMPIGMGDLFGIYKTQMRLLNTYYFEVKESENQKKHGANQGAIAAVADSNVFTDFMLPRTDPMQGARSVVDLIDRHIGKAMSALRTSGQVGDGMVVRFRVIVDPKTGAKELSYDLVRNGDSDEPYVATLPEQRRLVDQWFPRLQFGN